MDMKSVPLAMIQQYRHDLSDADKTFPSCLQPTLAQVAGVVPSTRIITGASPSASIPSAAAGDPSALTDYGATPSQHGGASPPNMSFLEYTLPAGGSSFQL